MTPPLCSPFRLSLVSLFLTGATLSCVEDGTVPDCPQKEEFMTEDDQVDFAAWREAAEEDGCLTPVGGVIEGGAGGAGS